MKLENVKVLEVLPERNGQSANGNQWRCQSYRVETAGDYQQRYEVEAWGDKIANTQMVAGKFYDIDFDLSSREYNGRLYYSLRAWKVTDLSAHVAPAQPAAPAQQIPGQSFEPSDQLPF